MIVNFGNGKCPLCGDFGKKIENRTFHCVKCDVAFDDFLIHHAAENENSMNKFWN